MRNRQFVRKIEVPMPVVSSGVKPSQFYDSQRGDIADVQDHGDEAAGVLEQKDGEQVPGCSDRGDATGNSVGMMIDDKVNHQDRDEVEIVDKGVADIAVGQQPEARSRRIRKPNSKYDPAVFDLGSIEIRGIPLSGKKNGWRGVYWPS